MSRQEKIIEIVKRVSKSDVAPDPEQSLFDSGYLDSFALTDMVGELEREVQHRDTGFGSDAPAVRFARAHRVLRGAAIGPSRVSLSKAMPAIVSFGRYLPAGRARQRRTGGAAAGGCLVDFKRQRH